MQSRHMVILQETRCLEKVSTCLEKVSWKIAYVSWRTVLSECFQDTRVAFKTHSSFSRRLPTFQDVRSRHLTYFQETIDTIKTHGDFSRDLSFFKSLIIFKIHCQETLKVIKTHSSFSRDIGIFSRDISVLKRRLERYLEKASWKGVLVNRLENRLFFSRRFSKTPNFVFKTPFQDAGVLKRRLERCLENNVSWKFS